MHRAVLQAVQRAPHELCALLLMAALAGVSGCAAAREAEQAWKWIAELLHAWCLAVRGAEPSERLLHLCFPSDAWRLQHLVWVGMAAALAEAEPC